MSDFQWLVRVDGEVFIVGNSQLVTKYLKTIEELGYTLTSVQIHHFLRMKLEEVEYILNSVCVPVYVYIHDFYTICSNGYGNLLQKDGTCCPVAFQKEPDCSKCSSYNLLTKEIRSFIKGRKETVFIAPSDSCKDIWTSFFPEHKENTIVIYHQDLIGNYSGKKELLSDCSSINIAYVGKQIPSKGWEDYKNIINRLSTICGYQYFCCGDDSEVLDTITNIRVDFHDGLNAMVDTLRTAKIDIVCLLSKWPETYSYTYYESMASGAFILAYGISGNIADQILKRKNGKIFNSKEEIENYLKNRDTVIADVNLFRNSNVLIPMELVENRDFVPLVLKNPEKAIIKSRILKVPEQLMGRIKAICYILENRLKKLL